MNFKKKLMILSLVFLINGILSQKVKYFIQNFFIKFILMINIIVEYLKYDVYVYIIILMFWVCYIIINFCNKK